MPANNEEEEINTFCYSCEEPYEEEDMYFSEHDHEMRCASCNEEHEEYYAEDEDDSGSDYIYNYSYKPSAIFINDDGHKSYYSSEYTDIAGKLRSQLYMGFELELEVGRGVSRNDCAEHVCETINEGNGDSVVYLKEDGSIQNGFEIVSHPMTLDFAMNHFKWNGISDLIKKGCKSWDATNCGLHIHMSRNAFVDDKHLFKFFKFLYDNSSDMKAFAGRSVSYAKWDKSAFLNGWRNYDETTGNYNMQFSSSFMKHAKGEGYNEDRYTAVNLQNRHTIELRFFRPSLNPNTVISALQFCEALFNYTETECNTQQIMSGGALAFRSFASWVKTQQRYSVLSERIAVRCSNHGDDN